MTCFFTSGSSCICFPPFAARSPPVSSSGGPPAWEAPLKVEEVLDHSLEAWAELPAAAPAGGPAPSTALLPRLSPLHVCLLGFSYLPSSAK